MPGYYVHCVSFERYAIDHGESIQYRPRGLCPKGVEFRLSGRYTIVSVGTHDVRDYDVWVTACCDVVAISPEAEYVGKLRGYADFDAIQEQLGDYALWPTRLLRQKTCVAHLLAGGQSICTRVFSNYEGGLDYYHKIQVDHLDEHGEVYALPSERNSIASFEWTHSQAAIVHGGVRLDPYADFTACCARCRDLGPCVFQHHEEGDDDLFLREKGYAPRYLRKALLALCDDVELADFVIVPLSPAQIG